MGVGSEDSRVLGLLFRGFPEPTAVDDIIQLNLFNYGCRVFSTMGLGFMRGFRVSAVDDRNPALPIKDPKPWELWYILYDG